MIRHLVLVLTAFALAGCPQSIRGDDGSTSDGGESSSSSDGGCAGTVAADACAKASAECGDLAVTDSCGVAQSVRCGSCPGGMSCADHHCGCPTGTDYCASLSACVDLATTATSCGSCGRSCADVLPGAASHCDSRECVSDGCLEGRYDCDGSVAGCESTTPCGPQTSPAMVSWVRFDGSGADEIESTGLSLTGVSFVADRAGNPGHAARFVADSSGFGGSYGERKADPALPVHAQPRSVSVWARSDHNTSSWRYRSLLGWGANSTGNRFGISTETDGSLEDVLFTGESQDVTTGVDIADGGWHHLCVTFDGSTLIVYVDGQNAGHWTPTLDTASSSGGADLEIGRSPGPQYSEHWSGDLDDLRIYARALTAEEVLALAQGS